MKDGDMSVISIDSGVSALKVIGCGRRLTVPAVAKWCDTTPSGTAVDGRVVVVDDATYLVGGDALADGERPTSDDLRTVSGFHGSPAQKAQIAHALQRIGAEGEHERLVLSLPYEDAFGAARERVCREYRRVTWRDAEGATHEVSFKEPPTTMPQGVGAFRRYCLDEEAFLSGVVLVDIGSQTLDIVLVSADDDGAYRYMSASSSVRNVNVAGFATDWSERIRRHDGAQGRTFGYHDLMRRAVRGHWTMDTRSGSLDLRRDYDGARSDFTRAVRTAVEDVAGPFYGDAARVVLTGGGAHLVEDRLWDDARIRRMDVWANAEGQYMSGLGLIGSDDRDEARRVLDALEG